MTQPEVFLKPGREKSLRRRHPWIFSGAVEQLRGEPRPGATVSVRSSRGEFLAQAAYSPASQIRLRILSFDEHDVIDASFIAERLEHALAARRAVGLLEPRGACRLVFAESDRLPGLVVDRYADFLVCQFLTAGAEHWRETVLDTLERRLEPRGIYERSEAGMRHKEGLASSRGLLRGEAPPARLEVELAGLTQLVDIEHGQKTGAYLDQRDNRRRVATWADGARVLDAYAYSGGFGLACLAAGAAEVTFLDSSAAALALVRAQAEHTGVAERCRYTEVDVATELRRLDATRARFDLIVLDPPKFVHTAQQVNAGCRAYKDVNRLALRLLEPGGRLASFSCSGHVDAALFQKVLAGAALEAPCAAQIVERLGQPADHPVALDFPESDYLKGLILRRMS